MYQGPTVAFMHQGPEEPWSSPDYSSFRSTSLHYQSHSTISQVPQRQPHMGSRAVRIGQYISRPDIVKCNKKRLYFLTFTLCYSTFMLTSTVCLHCVRFNFFASKPRHWLERTSPKWCTLSWVGRKTSGATCAICGSTLICTVTCMWTHAYQRCNWTHWKQWRCSQYMHIHACPHCSTPHQHERLFTHSLTHSLTPKANLRENWSKFLGWMP